MEYNPAQHPFLHAIACFLRYESEGFAESMEGSEHNNSDFKRLTIAIEYILNDVGQNSPLYLKLTTFNLLVDTPFSLTLQALHWIHQGCSKCL
ncbi:hypothetical protein LV85_02272 [Algoriphagus chordae]|uniref:Uncharacterized protein n=1 Tax=Algoriphagus chordae TaxID=237019 RepID=A0A2W7QRU7_9BACT|nr:hypothetical protein LV85_02272 [Algoriphagus chordae]